MRILHITATHLDNAGGVPVVLRDLVNAQNKIEGFTARVLSINADISTIESKYFDFLGEMTFKCYIEKYNPDLAIFHSHYYFEYIELAEILKKMGVKYYIEPHGSFGSAALKKSKFRKIIANNFILKKYMKYAYGYIFLNKAEKEDSLFRSENDIIIPNGISAEDCIHNIQHNDNYILYFIGRYDISHKGLDVLCDALKILDDKNQKFTIAFYGKGNEKETEYLMKRIIPFKNINAKNMGPIYGKQKDEYLEQCGIMLLTSRYEGFPMTVLEAWKYGNPCIVTERTNVYDEIIDNNIGWGTDFEAEAIAEIIIKACTEYRMHRNEYILRCKNYVSNYNWDEIAQKSLDVLF